MRRFILPLFLALLLIACDGKGDDAPSPATPAAQTETTATGYGKTHEDAYAEACAQAVSQVCGIRVDKAMISAGKERGAIGAASFDGAIKSVEELSSEREDDSTYKVMVKAIVCPPADPFAGKVALVLPREKSLMTGLGKLPTAEARNLAATLDGVMNSVAAESGHFVVLNRDSGDADAERELATSGSSRVDEQGKSRGLKVADYVVELKVLDANQDITSKEYAIAKTVKYSGSASVDYSMRLIETTTNGVAASENGSARGECKTSLQESQCISKVQDSLKADLVPKVEASVRSLLSKCPKK